MELSNCRICLNKDVRMYCILNTNLQEIYEILSLKPFETKKRRSFQVCYICYARLRNCQQLQLDCLHSEEFFTQTLNKNKLIPSLQNKTKLTIVHPIVNLSYAPQVLEETNDDINCSYRNIKIEPLDIIDVLQMKEENCADDASDYEDIIQLTIPHGSLESYNNNTTGESDYCDHYTQTQNRTAAYKGEIKNIVYEIPNKQDTLSEQKCDPKGNYFRSNNSIPSDSNGLTDDTSFKSAKIALQRIDSEMSSNYDNCVMKAKHQKNYTGSHPHKKTELPVRNEYRQSKEERKKLKTKSKKNDIFIKKKSKQTITGTREKNNFNDSDNKSEMLKCNLCEKFFTFKLNLKRHMKTHAGLKPYKCLSCKKCFSRQSHLEQHVRTHTGEEPYKCDVCTKCFKHKDNLMAHIRIHTGEKPFICGTCGKSFNRKCNLKTHTRIHTGEKPYECDICKKLFSHKVNLNDHIRRYHTTSM